MLQAINEAAGSDFEADGDDLFVVAHRFIRHGNRDWLTDTEEYDVSVGLEGRIAEGLDYDARISAYGLDGFVDGNTFVHVGRITSEIQAGHYDLADPFSDAPEHLRAIENSSLRLENDFGADFLGARLALEGSGIAIGGRNAAWTAGLELDSAQAHDTTLYRSNDGVAYDVSEVLGSGGASYAGKRKSAAAFAEMSVPLAENLDLRVAGRGDEYDDVGGMASWRLGADYRPSDVVTLRSSWSAGERAPSMVYLHSSELQDHPYIECDPGTGSPPRSCAELNPRQVTRVTAGNPELDPSDTERLAIGAEARREPFFLDVEWYRLSRSGLPGQNSANWAMQNLNECMDDDEANCIERTAGDITIRDSYANVVETDLSGFNTRLGGGYRTGWGVVGLRGAWRRVTSTELRIAGEEDRFAIPRNIVRLGVLARRGGLSAIWTASYRSSYTNRAGTGTFKSWTGHDVVLDWADPLALQGARVTSGVFNITDAGLSVNTANPSSVDGPTEAGWGAPSSSASMCSSDREKATARSDFRAPATESRSISSPMRFLCFDWGKCGNRTALESTKKHYLRSGLVSLGGRCGNGRDGEGAPRAGFEPATPALGGRCSIRLSYRGRRRMVRYRPQLLTRHAPKLSVPLE